MTSVDVDFNARTRDGLVRTRASANTLSALEVGQRVAVNDPVDGLQAEACVAGLDETHNLVYFDVDWHSFVDTDPQVPATRTA